MCLQTFFFSLKGTVVVAFSLTVIVVVVFSLTDTVVWRSLLQIL
jgi:hypothetical protein